MWERRSSERRHNPRIGSPRLGERRRKGRRRSSVALIILLFILAGAAIYGLQQPAVRISHIEVYGADPALKEVAARAMEGTYFGIIPRNSTFFIPEAEIRAEILREHDTVAAVSIFRKGFDGLVIKLIDRAPIAFWCGLAPTQGVDEYCYIFDASGAIYAAATPEIETINAFILYAPLEGDIAPNGVMPHQSEPLGSTLAHADQLPGTFDLARELATLGSAVSYIIIRGDEVEDHLLSGTRIIYVLGNEQYAFAALVSAKDHINLADGSLEYVDLRFDGKVYTKKKE